MTLPTKSENGWPLNPARTSRIVPGTAVRISVADGPAGDVLMYVASQFDQRVEDIDNGSGTLDDWGWADRPIRGSASQMSNHASATAIDLNAPRHPLAVRGTFSPAQRAEIHEILAEVGGVVGWGGDYSGRVDEMHFEIRASVAAVAAAAARLKTPASSVNPAPMEEEDIMIVPAAKDDYVSIPCNGKTLLFLSTAFGRTVTVLNIAAVKDNNGKNTPEYTSVQKGLRDINPDQPGPIAIGGGCRVIQLRYSADHDFTAWCA